MDEKNQSGAESGVPEAIFIGEPVPVEPQPSIAAPFLPQAPVVTGAAPVEIAAPAPTAPAPAAPEVAPAPVVATPIPPTAAAPAPAPADAPMPLVRQSAPVERPNVPVSTTTSKPLSLQRLRTYKDDIEVAVRAQNLSVAKVFLAEEERRRRSQDLAEASEPGSPKNRLYLALAGTLVVLGAATLVYFRFFHQPAPLGDLRIDLPTFVRTDEAKLIDATDKSLRDLASGVAEAMRAPIAERSVREVVVATRENDPKTAEPIYHRVLPLDLLTSVGAALPGNVGRALASSYFVGSYGSKTGTASLILLTVDDHAQAFAGMLEWEPTMARDLSQIFPEAWRYVSTAPKPLTEDVRLRRRATSTPATATTTAATSTAKLATSTGATSTSISRASSTPVTFTPGDRNKFDDVVISNKDARVLYGASRQVLLVYSFIDPSTILIGDDPILVSEISRRLAVDRQLH